MRKLFFGLIGRENIPVLASVGLHVLLFLALGSATMYAIREGFGEKPPAISICREFEEQEYDPTLKRAMFKTPALNVEGGVEAYGIGGGRAGAYGQRWGRGHLDSTTIAERPAVLMEEEVEILRDVPKGVSFDNLSNKNLDSSGSVDAHGLGGGKAGPYGVPTKTWQRSSQPTFARVYVGDNNSLQMVKLMVSVRVEGPRARTVVDHIFYNPHDRQLEGTFEYPLPTGASPCYYAMFVGRMNSRVPAFFAGTENAQNLVSLAPHEMAGRAGKEEWGELKEARIVRKETARVAYEETTRRRIDPAVLEYSGANIFRGRVFPIPMHGYSRVIMAYEQTLETVGDSLRYRFPLPDCELGSLSFTLTAPVEKCGDPQINVPEIKEVHGDGWLFYTREWMKKGPGGEAVFSFAPPDRGIHYITGRDGSGTYYFYAHLRPGISSKDAAPSGRHAVFMVDTSLSEHPDRFNTSVKLLKAILERDSSIENFQVMLFDVGAGWLLEPEDFWLENTKEGREKALAALNTVLLEGATDLSAALDLIAGEEELAGKSVDIFLLSDGQVNWGRTEANQLVARFESRAKFTSRFF
jgi:hypothetical protein